MNQLLKNQTSIKIAIALLVSIVLTVVAAAPAEAQLNSRTAGVHLEYQNEHSALGAGVQFNYAFSHRISAGITGALFMPDNIQRVVSNTRLDYVQNLFSGVAYVRAEILRSGNFQIYGKPGVIIQRISRKGERVTFNDAPPFDIERRELDTSSVIGSPAAAAGIEWRHSLILFVEPLLYFNSGVNLNYTAGIRVPI